MNEIPAPPSDAYTPQELSSQRAMMAAALARSQRSLAAPDNSFGSSIGAAARGVADSGPVSLARRVGAAPFNHGPALGGVAGTGLGAAAGYGIGKLINRFSDDEDENDRSTSGALIGAALGGLGGTMLGGMRQKAASGFGGDLDYVRMRIFQDPELDSSDRQGLLSAVSNLSDPQLSSLGNLLRTAVGAGIGALISKFMLRTGFGGTLLGAAIGGILGMRVGGPSMLGKTRHTGSHDVYGNSFNL
jgi:hypothetical protein